MLLSSDATPIVFWCCDHFVIILLNHLFIYFCVCESHVISPCVSAGGGVALRRVHQRSLLQPRKIGGKFEWRLGNWNFTQLSDASSNLCLWWLGGWIIELFKNTFWNEKQFFSVIRQLLEVISSTKVNWINISDCSPLLSTGSLLLWVVFVVKFNRLLYFICSPFIYIGVGLF